MLMNTFSVFSRGPAEHEHFAGGWLDQCFTVTSFSIPFWAGDDALCKKPQTARKRKWHCSTLHHCSLATHWCFHKSTTGHVRHSFDHRMQFLHNLFFLFLAAAAIPSCLGNAMAKAPRHHSTCAAETMS